MENLVFTGAATALITPMTEQGVDFQKLEELVEWQIEEGIDALVAAGTTGEGSTLTDEEHKEVISCIVETAAKRVPVIAGTGSNDTAYAADLTKYACDAGADAMLLVTPYYNKATQNGLIKSFEYLADISTKPCILYNVPSRTGCNLMPETCAKLAEHPNILGVKEASGNISQIAKIAALCRGRMALYSGNDDQIIPVMSLGGQGVISVLSNVMPKQTSEMCHLYLDGKTQEALKMQLDYIDLIDALFCEVNPIPVKAAMAAMGMCEDYLRLPLTPMEDRNREKLIVLMKQHGLI
jgi:4-hydroxy-tetrahydrodipicolinate synthase